MIVKELFKHFLFHSVNMVASIVFDKYFQPQFHRLCQKAPQTLPEKAKVAKNLNCLSNKAKESPLKVGKKKN